MNKPFLQIGATVIAVAHIVYFYIHPASGAVTIHLTGDSGPLLFKAGTPEAKALVDWAQSPLTTQCLLPAPKKS